MSSIRTNDSITTDYLTIDGNIDLSEDDARKLSRNFFFGGFLALPFLWLVNCYYFWPVLRNNSDPVIKKYVKRSGIGFLVFLFLFLPWTLTYSIGGEKVLGSVWNKLAVYNLADQIQTILETL